MSRPVVMDEKKKQKIVTMVHWGVSITAIADYLGCSRRTIYRLREADAEFDEEVRAAGMQAQLKPMDALRRASATHWRAAAYLLEREERMQAERHDRRQAAAREAHLHAIRDEVVRMVRSRLWDPSDRIEFQQEIEALFTDSPQKKRRAATRDLTPSWRKAALALERLTPLVESARQALDDRPEIDEVRYRHTTTRDVEPKLTAPTPDKDSSDKESSAEDMSPEPMSPEEMSAWEVEDRRISATLAEVYQEAMASERALVGDIERVKSQLR